MTGWGRRRRVSGSVVLAIGLLAAADAYGGQAAPAEVVADYRAWVTTQPDDVRARYPESYREHLAGLGFDPPLIERRIEIVALHTEPNAFLVEMTKSRPVGTALDVGRGQGRNALYLAAEGWEVTGLDPAGEAVALARERWDLILLSDIEARTLVDEIVASLRPGGLLVLEAFPGDAAEGPSMGRGAALATDELVGLFDALQIVRYEDTVTRADVGPDAPIRVVRLAAVKPTRD